MWEAAKERVQQKKLVVSFSFPHTAGSAANMANLKQVSLVALGEGAHRFMGLALNVCVGMPSTPFHCCNELVINSRSQHSTFQLMYSSLKKFQNAPKPSEHPPIRGKTIKTFRWDCCCTMQMQYMTNLKVSADLFFAEIDAKKEALLPF